MKKYLTVFAASAALALGSTAVQAQTQQERGEARLAEMIEGRVAGEPQSCITTFRSNNLQVIPYVGLVYEQGDTIYVARATNPQLLRRTDMLVIDRNSSQLCRTDVILTMDRGSDAPTGSLFIEDWVPYVDASED